MSRINPYKFKDIFRDFSNVFSLKTALLDSATLRSTAVTFMKPSTFFGLSLYRNFNVNSYFVARDCLNSCTKCVKHLTSWNHDVLKYMFRKHLYSIAVQKSRKSGQTFVLYRTLGYDRFNFRSLIGEWLRSFLKRERRSTWCYLLGATIFAWSEDKVSDSEIERVSNELSAAKDFSTQPNLDWELIVNKSDVQIWRKAMPRSGLYQYRVKGTYKDVSARAFFQTQVDLEFRRQWDKHVISLDVVDKDESSGTEVVHWITEFPYPMSSREYVYIRRHKIDPDRKLMVIVSRGIPHHPAVPPCSNHIRVTDYCSEMVIKPHTAFDENGFDYLLTYFDDPKSAIPKVALSWAASSGIPDFVDNLYNAAVVLQHRKKVVPSEVSFKNNSLQEIEVNDENKVPM